MSFPLFLVKIFRVIHNLHILNKYKVFVRAEFANIEIESLQPMPVAAAETEDDRAGLAHLSLGAPALGADGAARAHALLARGLRGRRTRLHRRRRPGRQFNRLWALATFWAGIGDIFWAAFWAAIQ